MTAVRDILAQAVELGPARIAGIDYSTHAIDIVTIPLHGTRADDARWVHIELPTVHGARLARAVRPRLARITWENVQLVYVEEPWNRNVGVMKVLARLQGAIVALIPATVAIVEEVPAGQWKRYFGVSGNASKVEVGERARELGFAPDGDGAGDAVDAFGIAYAMREAMNQAAEQTRGVLV